MKKIFLALPALAALFVATPVLAATINVSPKTVTVAPGDTVSVTLSVDPEGTSLSVVKASLAYTDSLLTPTAFTFAPTWIPITQSGYDQMGGGTLTKTGGYPGGVASSTTFGTITFTAKAAGTATVSVQNSSVAYDASTDNVLSGVQGSATITVSQNSAGGTASSTTPTAVAALANTVLQTGPSASASRPSDAALTSGQSQQSLARTASAGAVTPADSTAPATSSNATGNTILNDQTAAVANASGAGFLGSLWSWLLLILFLVVIAGGSWYYATTRREV